MDTRLDYEYYIKNKYNETLKRYELACSWVDNKARTFSELDMHIEKFKNIASELSRLLRCIGEYTNEEAMNGFKNMGEFKEKIQI